MFQYLGRPAPVSIVILYCFCYYCMTNRCATTALSHANHDLSNIHLLLCNTVEKIGNGNPLSINNSYSNRADNESHILTDRLCCVAQLF